MTYLCVLHLAHIMFYAATTLTLLVKTLDQE